MLSANALAASPCSLALLLAPLDRRLHEVTSSFELAKDAFGRHFSLEMLDRSFDPLVTYGNFEGFALYCL